MGVFKRTVVGFVSVLTFQGLILSMLVLGPAGFTPIVAGDAAADQDRWAGPQRLLVESAEWVTFEGGMGVVGSETSATVFVAQRALTPAGKIRLEQPVTHGVLARRDLYLVERSERADRLVRLNLDAKDAVPVPVELVPSPTGELYLARMDDYVLVVESGHGLRILRLPHPMHGDHAAQAGNNPEQVASLPLSDPVTAVATSLRMIYLATDRGWTIVNAQTPSRPVVIRTILAEGPQVHGLAANGGMLYAMTKQGLSLVDLDGRDSMREQAYPAVRGGGIYLAGRSLYVAGGRDGLVAFEDLSPTFATIFIQVGDFFFNPAGLVNVNQNDTVTWQKGTTNARHNVFSCNPAQAGCGGVASTEVFTSGATTTSPFTLSHTFTVPGNNPYVCQPHNSTMQGDIAVTAAAVSPPGVADGRSGTTPMTVGKLTADGSDLEIFYDPGTCGGDADDHNILFGDATDLPASLGGGYGVAGARCNVGLVSPFTWNSSPSVPLANDLLWWLIVADDGSGNEGSWSVDSAGGERTGPGTNGVSNRCFNTDKDLSNPCPP